MHILDLNDLKDYADQLDRRIDYVVEENYEDASVMNLASVYGEMPFARVEKGKTQTTAAIVTIYFELIDEELEEPDFDSDAFIKNVLDNIKDINDGGTAEIVSADFGAVTLLELK
jgi:hypothetical protein